ncbi:hypothetical protein Z517_00709 [Fonsecaea pedrosoi CBS 271.37]|uniref:Uncharacterized protein n=1 Tax=Fonsecaea pedrosoi CBS 271.37 TaxID=1442368 RepID=A0A0D2HLF6_9EURO|nr:uncharacterized protein Z517_00709 [Fonsecaea pedrosoi CBS 271.37]KIW85319.1 hypothetical protein Z517_00709 [Fonsecaea pedrosoi CBS 271.37]
MSHTSSSSSSSSSDDDAEASATAPSSSSSPNSTTPPQETPEVTDHLAMRQACVQPIRGRSMSRGWDKAVKCAQITTENERARKEIEAAGCHVKDYATGYGTRTCGGEKGPTKE